MMPIKIESFYFIINLSKNRNVNFKDREHPDVQKGIQ